MKDSVKMFLTLWVLMLFGIAAFMLLGCKRDMASVSAELQLQSKEFFGIETITERTYERPTMQLLYKRHLDEQLEAMSVVKFENAYYITYRKLWDMREVIYHEGPYSCRDMDSTHYCPLHQDVPDIIGLVTEGANNYRIYIKTYSNEDFYDAKRSYENDWIKRLSGAGDRHCKGGAGSHRSAQNGVVAAAQARRFRACDSGCGGTLAAADTAAHKRCDRSGLFLSPDSGTGLQQKGAGTAAGSAFVSRAAGSAEMEGVL